MFDRIFCVGTNFEHNKKGRARGKKAHYSNAFADLGDNTIDRCLLVKTHNLQCQVGLRDKKCQIAINLGFWWCLGMNNRGTALVYDFTSGYGFSAMMPHPGAKKNRTRGHTHNWLPLDRPYTSWLFFVGNWSSTTT